MKYFNNLAYNNVNDFIFGRSLYPVKLNNGLVIGAGQVIPELNYTMPPMTIDDSTMGDVLTQYREMTEDACKRAVDLYCKEFIIEAELLPPTTYRPEWGVTIVQEIRSVLNRFEAEHDFKSAIRLTPVDIREDLKSPHMWRGSHWDAIMQTFQLGAEAGADLLSIESIGGKDIHDDATMFCELDKSIFSLGVLGVRDMHQLWSSISGIAASTGTISAGDTACGFANTAMVLADRGYIPKVYAAVVRVISAVRSLAAIEAGAVGPHKDCGYEGVFVKAITGTPISMEGKSSAVAHLSPVGNIAACVADMWSNESIQNIKLLGGMAPTVSAEQLIYDCRLMNKATEKGPESALLLRDLMADSDSFYDPQAYVLRPDVVLELSKKILAVESPLERSKVAAFATLDILQEASLSGELQIDEKETMWFDVLKQQLDSIPDSEERFIGEMVDKCKNDKFNPEKYDL